MSHIHIPDGVLPVWMIILGWALTGVFMAVSVRVLRDSDSARRLPLLGALSALMVVAMTIELVPLAYHVNLVALSGIVLGPPLTFLAAFIVNLILALFGHGGTTVIGLNTIVIAAEGIFGYLAFIAILRLLRVQTRLGLAAGAGTVVALFLSTLLMIGAVSLSNLGPTYQGHELAEEGGGAPQSITRVFAFELLSGGEESPEAAETSIDVATFAKLTLGLGFIGWLIEGVLTGLVVSYIRRIRPDIVNAGGG